ncbi:hypothetical protein D5086_013573 [Populus alba]|uniref:Uncharacterized protein n=1 Tax=Populus alba TaxID=43335 RepID=A0ACC4C6I2_POPAL
METIATNHIDAHKNIRSIGIPSSEDMKGLRSNHHRSILKIKEAGRCFLDEYKGLETVVLRRLSSCKIYNSVPEEEQHFNWLQDNAIQMSAVIFTRHINMFVFSHHSQITKRENIENEQWQNTRRCKATV